MMMCRTLLAATAVLGIQASAPQVQLKTASAHPMQYYLSLPDGWSPNRKWPTLVVIEGANRDFQQTAQAFVTERKSRPFIIVVPLVLTAGGSAQQHKTDFPYSDSVWSAATQEGNCRFDEDGISAVLADVRRLYSAEDRDFLTGWEAGGHVVWAQVLQHPERWRGVAIVSPNFQARCVDDQRISSDTTRSTLSVTVLHGDSTAGWGPGQFLPTQFERARSLAAAHGFAQPREIAVAPYHHGPLAHEVLQLFSALLRE